MRVWCARRAAKPSRVQSRELPRSQECSLMVPYGAGSVSGTETRTLARLPWCERRPALLAHDRSGRAPRHHHATCIPAAALHAGHSARRFGCLRVSPRNPVSRCSDATLAAGTAQRARPTLTGCCTEPCTKRCGGSCSSATPPRPSSHPGRRARRCRCSTPRRRPHCCDEPRGRHRTPLSCLPSARGCAAVRSPRSPGRRSISTHGRRPCGSFDPLSRRRLACGSR